MRKTTLKSLNNCSMQKTDLKAANIREIRGFLKWAQMATRPLGYSLCKMVSLGQKVKFLKTYEKRL